MSYNFTIYYEMLCMSHYAYQDLWRLWIEDDYDDNNYDDDD